MARDPNRLELPIHSYSLMSFESLRHALQPRIHIYIYIYIYTPVLTHTNTRIHI